MRADVARAIMEAPNSSSQAELSTTVRASRWGEIVEAGGGDGAAEGTSHLGFLESDPIDKSLTGERFLSVLSGDGGAVLGERRLSRRAGIAEA